MSTASGGTSFPRSLGSARSDAQGPQKWNCLSCSKTSYIDEIRAWRAIGNITRLNEAQGAKNKDRPCRVYACPHGNGYHLTSKYEDWKP